MRLAGNAVCKKSPKSRHLRTIAQLCRAISLPDVPHNMVNFGLLAAEIDLGVWGTPTNFNGFRVLAALLHGSQVVSISQTLRR